MLAAQVSAAIQAVNLAAPYAKLSSSSAPGDLAAALRGIGATYSPQSLQVCPPAVKLSVSWSRPLQTVNVRQPCCVRARAWLCTLCWGQWPEVTLADPAISSMAMGLQVTAPAWAAEAAQAARDPAHEGKLRFVMSGVSLPRLDETRLRCAPALQEHRNVRLLGAMLTFAGSLLSCCCLLRGSSRTQLRSTLQPVPTDRRR